MRRITKQQKLTLVVLGVLVLGGGVLLAVRHHNQPVAVTTPTVTPTPSPGHPGNPGDVAKEALSSPSPSASPAASPTATPASTGAFINSFSINGVSGGYHIATILSGLTSGNCSVVISPSGGSAITKTGSVTLSGTTYMCDFGGNIAGSAGAGTAVLTVTNGSGQSDHLSVSFQ